jgi:hypothetical protein
MNQPDSVESIDRDSLSSRSNAEQSRVMGSPLPVGSGRRPISSPAPANRVPPGRSLPGSASGDEPTGAQRAVNLFRTVMPIVQRLLPLLEGNVLTAISNVMTPRPQAPPPAPKVDLAPLETSLAALQTEHRGLREQVTEQNASLKRVEDQLEMVREATDRNTLEQQELLEDLKAFSGKFKVFAVVGIGVLVIGIVLNVILLLHIQRVLP